MGLNTILYEVVSKEMFEEYPENFSSLVIDDNNHKRHEICAMFKNLVYPIENEYYDIDKILKRRDKNLKFNDFIIISECGNVYELCPIADWNLPIDDYTERTKNKIVIKINKKSPTCRVLENVLYVKEIYDKRKGANKAFYEDGNWDTGGYITDKKELLEHYEKYFSFYALMEEEKYIPKKIPKTFYDDFKYAIMDNFIEGKHILIYG